jgi:hypothetical protein
MGSQIGPIKLNLCLVGLYFQVTATLFRPASPPFFLIGRSSSFIRFVSFLLWPLVADQAISRRPLAGSRRRQTRTMPSGRRFTIHQLRSVLDVDHSITNSSSIRCVLPATPTSSGRNPIWYRLFLTVNYLLITCYFTCACVLANHVFLQIGLARLHRWTR